MADNKTDDKFEMMYLKMQSILKKNNGGAGGSSRSNLGSAEKKFRNSSVIPKSKGSGTTSPASVSNWAMFSTKISEF